VRNSAPSLERTRRYWQDVPRWVGGFWVGEYVSNTRRAAETGSAVRVAILPAVAERKILLFFRLPNHGPDSTLDAPPQTVTPCALTPSGLPCSLISFQGLAAVRQSDTGRCRTPPAILLHHGVRLAGQSAATNVGSAGIETIRGAGRCVLKTSPKSFPPSRGGR